MNHEKIKTSMKISLLRIHIVLASVFLFSMLACTDIVEQDPLQPGTVEIVGKLYANLDESSFQKQVVPEGTGVTFVIGGDQLDVSPDPDYQYKDIKVRTTVDQNGIYTVELPAGQGKTEANILYDDFEHTAKVISVNDEGYQELIEDRRTFSKSQDRLEYVGGQSLIRDFTYSLVDKEFGFIESAIIMGEVTAILTDNIGEVTSLSDTTLVEGSGYVSDNNVSTTTNGDGEGLTINIVASERGPIDELNINTLVPGTNYQSRSNVQTITNGLGVGATVDIDEVTDIINSVDGLDLSTLIGGSGYDNAQEVTTSTNGDGTGLVVDITTDNGSVINILIQEPGNGYQPGDIIVMEEGNNNATIEVESINIGGSIQDLSIQNRGENYLPGDVLTISGGDNNASVNIETVSETGEILSVSVNEPGKNYKIGDLISPVGGDGRATIAIESVNPQPETVPEGVVLTFSVDGESYRTVTHNDGRYFIKVPAGAVAIKGFDFITPTIVFDEEMDEFVTEDRTYVHSGTSLLTADGEIRKVDLLYTRD